MGILWKVFRELERTDAQRMIKDHQCAENVPPEAAAMSSIVVLDQAGALLEKIGYLLERQQCHDEGSEHDAADHENDNDAQPFDAGLGAEVRMIGDDRERLLPARKLGSQYRAWPAPWRTEDQGDR